MLFAIVSAVSHFPLFNEQNQAPEMFYKKGVFKNFAKFTGKHPCQSLFFNKIAGLQNGQTYSNNSPAKAEKRFTDWMCFLPSNLMEEISPSRIDEKTKTI